MAKARDWQCPHCGADGVLIATHDIAFRMGKGEGAERAADFEEKLWKCNDCDGEIAKNDLPDELLLLLVGIRDYIERRLGNWKSAQATDSGKVVKGWLR